MAQSETLRLHRLLERETVAQLVQAFAPLMPAAEVAVLGAEGRLFVGSGEWQGVAPHGQPNPMADGQLIPLEVDSQRVGFVAARGDAPLPALQALQCGLRLLIQEALARREIARETLDRYREINLLYKVGETLSTSLDLEEILRLALAEAARMVQVDAGLALATSPATEDAAGAWAASASLGAVGAFDAWPEAARNLAAQVRQTGRADILSMPEAGSVLCVPIKFQSRTRGVLILQRAPHQPIFTASDEKLVLALAQQAAIAMQTAYLHQREVQRQRMEEELQIGRRIQLSLLPTTLPQVPGWEFATYYQAAQQVGGDFYDVLILPHEPHRVGLVIADVTGKGVPAALMMAFSRAILRAEASTHSAPHVVLEHTNDWIRQGRPAHLFVSTFYATLDTQTGELRYASGGHDRPLWRRHATGECVKLTARGSLLGAFDDIAAEERQIDLAPGDSVLCYTDGVTEAMDEARNLFGEERLHAVLLANPEATAAQIVDAVVKAVTDFANGSPLSDDLTLLVIKRRLSS